MVGPGAGVRPQSRVHSLLLEKVREVSENDEKSSDLVRPEPGVKLPRKSVRPHGVTGLRVRGPNMAIEPFSVPYGSRRTSVSPGWPYLAATNAVSAASRKGSQSRQIRPPRFESQEESSCSVLHRAHTPRTAIGNALMARLMTIFRFFG